ncbi:vesicle-associated membrane protein 711-like isoform X2 [Miscanthus floridulus]|uniref:vesicle-associated membrane protein 711-like isoform X2 n=1 Tax=Miscanthus floridulus TaxID=154761 RepID=UPI003458A25A
MGKIEYAVVARGVVVLAEHYGAAAAGGNAGAVARQVLERLPAGGAGGDDCNISYTQDLHVFHVKRTDGLTALCMADDAAGRRVPFAFLEDINGRFVKAYGRTALTALAYAMNDEFSRVLAQQMDYYSNDASADRINRMRGEIDQVRSVMIDNIDRVLERGDRLELLVDKTATMQGDTMRFKRQARRFRNTMWWRNVKLTAAEIFILSVIVYLVLAYMCHGFTLPSCAP